MLTKVSSVFPVTRKSGINLEKRVKKPLLSLFCGFLSLSFYAHEAFFLNPRYQKLKVMREKTLRFLPPVLLQH